MDYPNKKDISFIDIYDDEVATYPRAVTYTGTVSTDSQDSKVLIADSDGDGFTTNFVEFGNNLVGFEEIRKGYYVFNGTEIRQVKGVTPSQQAITLDAPFTTPLSGDGLYVIKPILIDKISFKNTGDTAGSVYTKASPTALSTYSSTPLKPGEVISFDNSSLTPFVVDATATTVKLSNAFFFDVTDTINASGGGGTPAGSDTQVQYNNAGAFGADSGFTRDVATGNANLAKDVIQQSTVTFTGSGLDDLQIAPTFSGSTPTTYTITISSTGTPDTFDWTDGTNSGTNVPMDVMGNALSNGLVIGFMADTGHTNGDSWSWTYTKPEKFAFKLTDDFGGNFGSGLAGVLQKYENTAGGINREARLGITELPGEDFGEFFPTIEQSVTDNATYSAYRVIVDGISDGYRDLSTNDNSLYTLRANNFSIINTTFSTGSENGISFINELGITATRIGNLFGGNGTKITIDDVNEQITISNLPAYDDDAAAGTAGLTAGMVYMTTGSGAAPLNAAGILMIKQ